MNNKIPHALNVDSDGHWYLIDVSEEKNFQKWVKACDSGKFANMKKFDYFNKNRIDLPKLIIYEWEEKP